MNVDLWVGAAATLAGAMLGGSISLLLNRQQMRFEHTQRREAELNARYQQSVDRRFKAYSDFLTCSRIYRDSLRSLTDADNSDARRINEYAQSANSASALVFLTTENENTHNTCRLTVRTIGKIQTKLNDRNSHANWFDLNRQMADALRQFQVAARTELGVGGVDPADILTHRSPSVVDPQVPNE